MLIGGIWIDEYTYNQVKEECNQYKLAIGWREDTKFNWKNVSNKALDKYKGFINIFFKYNLKFNAIILDKTIVNLKHNEEKDEELGFYKFYYQLLWHNSNNTDEYYIYLDRRNNKKETRLSDLKAVLRQEKSVTKGLTVKLELAGINVISVDAVNSKDYNLIQFSDILLGAIGFHYHKRHLMPDSCKAKIELASHISGNMDVKNLIFSTNKSGYKNFNIWLFKPKNERASYDLQSP